MKCSRAADIKTSVDKPGIPAISCGGRLPYYSTFCTITVNRVPKHAAGAGARGKIEMNPDPIKILCIDDNKDIIDNLVTILTKSGFLVYSAITPALGLAIAKKLEPELVLLDIMLPGMDGYAVCKALQQNLQTSKIPVVFLSALNQPQNKISALAAGGVDYITKPFDKEALLAVARRYAVKRAVVPGAALPPRVLRCLPGAGGGPCNFSDFKISVIDGFKLDGAGAKAVMALHPGDVYQLAGILGITSARVARLIAGFSKHPYLPVINPDDLKPDVLPEKFAVHNNIAAVNAPGGATLVATGHPFNFELHEMIHNLLGADFDFGITEPSNISVLYKLGAEYGTDSQKIPGTEGAALEESALNRLRTGAKSVQNEMNEPYVKYLTGKLLQYLAAEKNSEARIEAKGAVYLVSVGPADALEEFSRFNRKTGNMVVARLKALGGMDILERSKPQAGAFSIILRSETYRLALSTEAGSHGESLFLKPAV